MDTESYQKGLERGKPNSKGGELPKTRRCNVPGEETKAFPNPFELVLGDYRARQTQNE